MSDLDLSDVGPEHYVAEVDAQLIEMNARLDTMRTKNRPVEAQNLLRVRIAVMKKLRADLMLRVAEQPPLPAEPVEELSDELGDLDDSL